MNNSDSQLRHQAISRSQSKIAFYIHAIAYVLVNTGMATVNLLTTPGNLWFYWPLLVWGIGLLIHGLVTFQLRGYLGGGTQAQAKAAFYIHSIIYVVANAGMITLNLLAFPGDLWFYWPLLGWAGGLLGHGVGTFAHLRGMEEREYQKLKRQQGK